MAKTSFLQRFPHAGIIMVFAIVLAIPLTVWSLNNVSTQTEQQAQSTSTCTSNGGVCYKYWCPNGMAKIQGTCGALADPACCTGTLSAPTGVKAYSWYCNINGVEHDTINFNWSKVTYANQYVIHHRIYSTDNRYSYNTITVNGASSVNYLYNTKNLNGRRIQWYLTAKNTYSGYSSKSSTQTTPAAFLSCPQ